MLSSTNLYVSVTNELLSALEVKHNAQGKNRDICFEKKNDDSKIFLSFASPASEKTVIEIVYFTTFVERVEIGII